MAEFFLSFPGVGVLPCVNLMALNISDSCFLGVVGVRWCVRVGFEN